MQNNEYRFFVPPGHFYSPLVDREEAEHHLEHLSKSQSNWAGIKIDLAHMDQFWHHAESSMIHGGELIKAASGTRRFKFDNGFFDYGDALIYREILLRHRPSRVIEIGCGHSSSLLFDTIDEARLDTTVDFIEPYPNVLKSVVDPSSMQSATLYENKIQDMSIEFFTNMRARDILFIDSSHVVKTGSDVCFEILEIVPRLAPGVLIHFHDIFDNFEYPHAWAVSDNRCWNECYLLRALMINNPRMRILFFNDFFYNRRRELVNRSQSLFKFNPGGSIWIEVL